MQKARDAFEREYEFRRVETVGPRVSGELVQSGTIGVILSVLAVLLYLWFRFERELAMGAIVGTLHDIVLTIGFFVVTQIEFNMTSIAAILTIVGYSLNETVVVFDRTRELLRRYKAMPAEELLDLSINSTMSRTVMTATTAFLSLLALVLFGGSAIEGFALVMLFGVVVCTYSAIFISSPVLIYIGAIGRAEAPARRPAGAAAGGVGSWPAGSMRASSRAGIRSRATAPAASASPRCRTGARSWRCPPAFMPGSRASAAEFSVDAFSPVIAEAAAIDVLLIGTGLNPAPLPEALRWRLKDAGIGVDAMQTGAAARTYNILLAENRKVAAALVAVP